MGKIHDFFVRHPFLKGVVSYTILWPTANICNQKRAGTQTIDWKEVARYGAVGVTCVCPVFYGWLKFINGVYPGHTLKHCVIKVIVEQTFYWPIAIAVFFGGMNFYEGQTFEHFTAELKEKYWKTHKTGLMFWPFVAPIVNYSKLVADHNRTPIAAVSSFLWANFLSYVKSLEVKNSPGGKN